MSLFHEGDIVTIRSDLKEGKLYRAVDEETFEFFGSGCFVVNEMAEISGKPFLISKVCIDHDGDIRYKIKEAYTFPVQPFMYDPVPIGSWYSWTDEMFDETFRMHKEFLKVHHEEDIKSVSEKDISEALSGLGYT